VTLQNRVSPLSEIAANGERGLLMGNRGILHDAHQRLGRARWRHKNWVCCLLSFKNRHRRVMTPNHYTELFFLDEAVALAAGHRPCAECRRADYLTYQHAWQTATGSSANARSLDAALHLARIDGHGQKHHSASAESLPDGTFILIDQSAHLLAGDQAHPYAPGGYTASIPRPQGIVSVVTPAPSVAAMAAGYRPQLHPSARLSSALHPA